MTDADSARTKLWEMIRKYRFAMLTTQEADGALRSRPMTTLEREYDGSLWFFAAYHSAAATSLSRHPQVCLSYSDSENADFVCVAGPGSVVTDVARKKELWNPMVQAWFPEGAESPRTVLIQVTPDHAEYWDSASNKLVQLFGLARALISGTPPDGLGEHRTVPLAGAAKSVS